METRKQDGEDEKQVQMSELNPKYPKMVGEYIYKDVLFLHWTRKESIEKVERDFEFRSDDVAIVTFPKCGTTLMQELVWLVLHKGDTQSARCQPIYLRSPFLEGTWEQKFPGRSAECPPVDYLPDMPSPRPIKTHLPIEILWPRLQRAGAKTVFVVRNPKDAMVSYFHFYKGVTDHGPWPWDFHRFFRMWMDRWIVCGDWFKVTKDWWAQRHSPNLLVVKFEDLVRRPQRETRRVAEFLDSSLNEAEVEKIAKAIAFDSMQANPSTNYQGVPGVTQSFAFIRAGQIGNWKDYFTVSESEEFDIIYQQEMGDTQLELEFE